MVGLAVVSHSAAAAEGICEIAAEMGGDAPIEPAGGDGEGGIGTSAPAIREAIEAADDGDGVVVLVDLGSAVMSAETAAELVAAEDVEVRFADAPVVEGTVEAAVEAASSKATLESVVERAEGVREYRKFD